MLYIGSHVGFNKSSQLLGSLEEALSYGQSSESVYTGSRTAFTLREIACMCFIFAQALSIVLSGQFWGSGMNAFLSVLNKMFQVFAAAVGFYALTKVYSHRVYKILLAFDVSYLLTCLINANMFENLKTFIHFFILQGVFFYVVRRRRQIARPRGHEQEDRRIQRAFPPFRS